MRVFKFILLLAVVLTAFLLPVASAQEAPDGLPVDLRYQRGIIGSLNFEAQVASDIPQTIIDGLRAGGWNLQFGYYNVDEYRPRMFDAELPLIAAEGWGHVRLPMSMDTIEAGTSGRVRDDRYADLLNFIALANSHGLVVIVDVHNTGMKDCATCGWSETYMGKLSDPAHRARHLSLLTDLAGRLGRDADTDWFVLQPANEPITPQPWYAYQPQLFAAMRQACAACVLFVMAADWQGVQETIYNLDTGFIDSRTIVDVHIYDPLPLTHCQYPGQANRCPGLTFPGTFTDWRGTLYWDGARLESSIRPLYEWQQARGVPFVHFSEIGTTAALAEDVRTAYMCTLTDILQRYGFGFTIYERLQNFGKYGAGVTACAAGGSGEPLPVTPVTPPAVTPPAATAVPVTPDPSGYPRALATNDARITVYENAPPIGSRRTFTVAVDSSINVRRVMLYSGDRWLADDSSPPYTFTLDAAPGQTYSALVVYNARDEFYRADFQFGDAPAVTPTTPGPTAEQPTPTATLPATDVPTVPPTTDFSEAARILREVAQLYEELADILEGEN